MAYTASQFTITNKSLGIAQGIPTDARSWFYDPTYFKSRPYTSLEEVLTHLNTASKRLGHFPIFINTTGVLDNGDIIGGSTEEWWFKDGVSNVHLVKKSSNQFDNGLSLVDGKVGLGGELTRNATIITNDKTFAFQSSLEAEPFASFADKSIIFKFPTWEGLFHVEAGTEGEYGAAKGEIALYGSGSSNIRSSRVGYDSGLVTEYYRTQVGSFYNKPESEYNPDLSYPDPRVQAYLDTYTDANGNARASMTTEFYDGPWTGSYDTMEREDWHWANITIGGAPAANPANSILIQTEDDYYNRNDGRDTVSKIFIDETGILLASYEYYEPQKGIKIKYKGDLTFHAYDSNRVADAAAYAQLGVDVNGNVVLTNALGGGAANVSFQNGLSKGADQIAKLGGSPLTANTVVDTSTYSLTLGSGSSNAGMVKLMSYTGDIGVTTGTAWISHHAGNFDAKVQADSSGTGSNVYMQTRPNGGIPITIGANNTYAYMHHGTTPQGIRVSAGGEIAFTAYPDTRNDGVLTKVLGTDASGNLKLGTVSGGSGSSYTFNGGLTNTSGTVKLGGTLNSNVLLNGLDNYNVVFLDINTFQATAGAIQLSSATHIAMESSVVSLTSLAGTGEAVVVANEYGELSRSTSAGGNIYTTDGTLTESRVVTLDSNTISFIDYPDSDFIMDVDSGAKALRVTAKKFGITNTLQVGALFLDSYISQDSTGNNTIISQDFDSIGLSANANTATIASSINVAPDKIRITPYQGDFNIETLNISSSADDKLMVWDNVTKRVAYRDLSESGGNFYIMDGTLSGDRLIEGDSHSLVYSGLSALEVYADSVSYEMAYDFTIRPANFRIQDANIYWMIGRDRATRTTAAFEHYLAYDLTTMEVAYSPVSAMTENGIILKSPNGTMYKLTVGNDGALVTTNISPATTTTTTII